MFDMLDKKKKVNQMSFPALLFNIGLSEDQGRPIAEVRPAATTKSATGNAAQTKPATGGTAKSEPTTRFTGGGARTGSDIEVVEASLLHVV